MDTYPPIHLLTYSPTHLLTYSFTHETPMNTLRIAIITCFLLCFTGCDTTSSIPQPTHPKPEGMTDATNAATVYDQAAKTFVKKIPRGQRDEVDVLILGGGWRDLEEVVSRDVFQPSLDDVRKATAYPYCHWDIDYRKGFLPSSQLPMRFHNVARILQRILESETQKEWNRGNTDAALAYWKDGMILARRASRYAGFIIVNPGLEYRLGHEKWWLDFIRSHAASLDARQKEEIRGALLGLEPLPTLTQSAAFKKDMAIYMTKIDSATMWWIAKVTLKTEDSPIGITRKWFGREEREAEIPELEKWFDAWIPYTELPAEEYREKMKDFLPRGKNDYAREVFLFCVHDQDELINAYAENETLMEETLKILEK